MKERLRAGRRIGPCKGVATALVFAALWAAAARAEVQRTTVLYVSRERLARGVAVSLDGRPQFIQKSGVPPEVANLNFDIPGEDEPLAVALVEENRGGQADDIVIPVRIDDKILREGALLKLVDHKGRALEVKLPVWKAFLPIPKSFPITGVYDSPEEGETGRELIVTVYPRITKKAKVSLNDSATEGLVIDVKYEGLGAVKFKDFLNRLNRRDLDGTFLMTDREKPREKWSFFVRNFFENFDKRDVAIMRDQPLSPNVLVQARADNIQSLTNLSLGGNAYYLIEPDEAGGQRGYVKLGNVDRIIKDRTHAEAVYRPADGLLLKTRMEGFEVKASEFRAVPALKVEKTGWQVEWDPEAGRSRLLMGTLKFEDYDDYGEIDDRFSFIASSGFPFGRGKQSRRRGKSLTWSGDLRFDYAGVGDDTWLKGEMNLTMDYRRNNLIIGRFNEDFFRVSGDRRRSPWQSRFISLMRTRDFFNRNDLLNRWGLDTLFLDFEAKREEAGAPFTASWKLGVSRYLRLKDYDIPVDLFLEMDDSGELAPSLEVSIRQFL